MDTVKIKSQSGQHMKKKEKKNFKSVQFWVMNNPDGTMKECEKHTGLSHVTVRKHMRALGVK